MGCSTNIQNIKVEPMRVFWGREHCRNYILTEDADDSAGKYILIDVYDESYAITHGYIWVDDGVANDPAPAGKTLLGSVVVTPGDTIAEVVAAIIAEFEFSDDNDFYAKSGQTSAEFCLCNKFIGYVDNTAEGLGDIGATKTVEEQGAGGELGATSGGVELSFETQSIEIKSDQTGDLVLDDVYSGSTAGASMSLIELTKAILKTVFASVTGESLTPAGGTEVIGQGQSKLYKSLYSYSGKLILHPVRISDLSDRSEDWCFWKSAPLPESVAMSGTEQKSLSTSFKAYLDKSKAQEVNLWVHGDWLQDFEA